MTTKSEAVKRPKPLLGPVIVPEEEVHDAIEYLRRSAFEIGKAREDLVRSEHMVKHIEAIGYLSAQGSQEARKAQARTQDRWEKATTEHAEAAGQYEKHRSLRTAAEMTIEVWRSQQANLRGKL